MKSKLFMFFFALVAFTSCESDDSSSDDGGGGGLQPSELPARVSVTANGVSFDMLRVDGGTFIMGATSEQEGDASSDEKPAHLVTLTTFYMAETEVTQELWQTVMGTNPSAFSGSNLPVEYVSWDDCQTFIARLNAMTGQEFALPTEAQWEFAARGGNESEGYKYCGSNNVGDVAWYSSNSGNTTHAVGTKQPNELGFYDLSGNVQEWVNDRFGYYGSEHEVDPTGAESGTGRMYRGGSWSGAARYCRVSYRYSNRSDRKFNYLGLRLAAKVVKVTENNEEEELPGEEEQPGETPGTPEVEKKNWFVNGASFNMVKVEGGSFIMGGTYEQGDDVDRDELPIHRVTLDGYYIGETEVTQALWEAVMGSNPSYFIGTDLPVEGVSWNDCQEFVERLNALTEGNFALPTEAQWEFAARGGNKSEGYKYCGSDDIDAVAWYSDNSSGKIHAVGTKQPNELGLYDMSGNVWEWCSDWYGSYSSAAVTNPAGPASGFYRVNRGGSWFNYARICRTSDRHIITPDGRGSDLGLRLVSQL